METFNSISQQIKQKAIELGFNAVGIARAQSLQGFDKALLQWIDKGYHAEMEYMARNLEKRSDPTILIPGAKSVISLLTSYFPSTIQTDNVPQVAKYAYGTDYHFVIKEMMNQLWAFIQLYFPELDGRMFVDSAPVADKLWAVEAGLGWIGKNSCLINREIGSFVFVSELIINIKLDYDEPYRSNFCGSCTKCIDACPTKAIVKPGVIDSRKCISNWTIENKTDEIPEDIRKNQSNRLFGCDICQDVCPWNKKPLVTHIPEFTPKGDWLFYDRNKWLEMNKEDFNQLFKSSPLKRSKFEGLQRNLKSISDTSLSLQ